MSAMGNKERSAQTGKRKIFYILMLLIPVLFFVFLEGGLRLGGYGGDLRLFISAPGKLSQYWRINPDVGRRYFFRQKTVPTPSRDLFLKQKPTNGFRIFVLGGSSAAGFPYGNNLMFSRILQKRLQDAWPARRVEVVNLALTAVNTYTILDLLDEIWDQQPDLILLYAGHNEYYGALGVGSVESLGGAGFVRAYLALQKFRTVLLLRDLIGYLRDAQTNDAVGDPHQTLMARMVAQQTIPLDSDLYRAGLAQFRGNLQRIIDKMCRRNIPFIIGDLVCNLRDQPPFISLDEGDSLQSAAYFFRKAKRLETMRQYESADRDYRQARDLDALRFRAPEEFNKIIHELAGTNLAQVQRTFINHSPNGLIGRNLVLEHLHPNIDGYFLLADAFFNRIMERGLIAAEWDSALVKPADYYRHNWGYTPLDSVTAQLTVASLIAGWPFRPLAETNRFLERFQPGNVIEQIALRAVRDPEYTLEDGHLELARRWQKGNDLARAYGEYLALIASVPFETRFYESAATLLIKTENYAPAEALLKKSLTVIPTQFPYKWLGLIALKKNRAEEALHYLQQADQLSSNDPQILFNLARICYVTGRTGQAEELFERLNHLLPESDYIKHLKGLRARQSGIN